MLPFKKKKIKERKEKKKRGKEKKRGKKKNEQGGKIKGKKREGERGGKSFCDSENRALLGIGGRVQGGGRRGEKRCRHQWRSSLRERGKWGSKKAKP